MTLLPTLGGPNGGLNEMNVHGQIAGYAENNKTDSGCPTPQVLQAKPVVWTNNKVTELQTVDGDLQGMRHWLSTTAGRQRVPRARALHSASSSC